MTKKALNTQAAKEKVTQVLSQAKGSLKMLETFEKEAIAKARSYVKLPTAEEGRKLTGEKISAGLKKLGVVSIEEFNALVERVEKLEASLAAKSSRKSATSSASTESQPSA